MQVIKRSIKAAEKNQRFLDYHFSDPHLLGQDHDEASFRAYMDEAADRGAVMWGNGDIIGGITHRDPRYTARTLNDTVKAKDAFVNAMIEELEQIFAPYVDHLGGLGIGNHEYAFIQHYGANPILFLLDRLNARRSKALEPIAYMDYCGWIWTTYVSKNSNYFGHKTFYHHGIGGNTPVTEGIIGAKRLVESLDGVDCLVLGHTHKNWSVRNERFVLNRQGRVEARPVRLINTGSHQRAYKDHGDDNLAWSEMRGFRPGPMGGAFLHFIVGDKGLLTRVEH